MPDPRARTFACGAGGEAMKRGIRIVCLLCGVACLGATLVRAEVRLPAVFSDHMVLQGGAPVAVWGWADAGEEVTISIAGQSPTVKAGADGRWQVKLEPMKASATAEAMTVKAGNTIVV